MHIKEQELTAKDELKQQCRARPLIASPSEEGFLTRVLRLTGIPLRSAISLPTFSQMSDLRNAITQALLRYDKLNMITSPGITESWRSVSSIAQVDTAKASYTMYDDSVLYTMSNTSVVILLHSIKSKSSAATIPLENVPSVSEIHRAKPNTHSMRSWLSGEARVLYYDTIKVKYAWSPATSVSSTDYYPSSLTSLVSKEGTLSPEIPISASRFAKLMRGIKF